MKGVEFADILRVNTKGLKLSLSNWKIVNAILNCRTRVLGGHLYACSSCKKSEPRYNSCRNRHCPKCQGSQTAKWLKARAEELLPVPYFHLVFTIPHELNPIIIKNKKLLLSLLFKAQAKTLEDVSKKRLGKIAYFSVLHTWGQKLNFHPHIHTVVPGVYLKNSKTVVSSNKFFLPKKVLSTVFRAVFLKILVQEFNNSKFTYPEIEFYQIINKIKCKEWIVYAKKPFANPKVVLKYLARYTHRIAISNSRINSFNNNNVTFTYKDYKNRYKKKTLTLPAKEFLRRFFLHALPRDFVRIRYYGFLAPSNRNIFNKLADSLPKHTTLTYQAPQANLLCTHCNTDSLTHLCELKPLIFPASSLLKNNPFNKNNQFQILAAYSP